MFVRSVLTGNQWISGEGPDVLCALMSSHGSVHNHRPMRARVGLSRLAWGSADLPASLECAAKGDLVCVLQVTADGEA